MAISSYKVFKHKKIQAGDLLWRISVYTGVITPSQNIVSPAFTETKVPFKSMWAALETKDNFSVFDGMNIEQTISHIWYVRAIPNFPSPAYIAYKANLESATNYYRIVTVQNYDLRGEWIQLNTQFKGLQGT